LRFNFSGWINVRVISASGYHQNNRGIIKAVDDTFRQASFVGASKWETTSKIVFPIAFPNIITGLILSIGRVSGETAPILFTVAAYFLPKLPTSIFDRDGIALSFICDFDQRY
jgi:ABC-type phosphate transport system permease subunit